MRTERNRRRRAPPRSVATVQLQEEWEVQEIFVSSDEWIREALGDLGEHATTRHSRRDASGPLSYPIEVAFL